MVHGQIIGRGVLRGFQKPPRHVQRKQLAGYLSLAAQVPVDVPRDVQHKVANLHSV